MSGVPPDTSNQHAFYAVKFDYFLNYNKIVYTNLPPELIHAYQNTIYKINDFDIQIRIGETTPKLDEILEEKGYNSWAFITAWNPHSESLPEVQNKSRNKILEKEINDLGLEYFKGAGVGEDDTWPPEPSFLILNMRENTAKHLGNKYQQNAIVFGSIYQQAQLILLR